MVRDGADLQGPQRLVSRTEAPRCLFRLAASVFESDPLIYPATLFWRRFGCAALVGGILFSAKFICMGKSGGGPGFDSPPYKKCAHFAHFAETLCRVTLNPLPLLTQRATERRGTQGHQRVDVVDGQDSPTYPVRQGDYPRGTYRVPAEHREVPRQEEPRLAGPASPGGC